MRGNKFLLCFLALTVLFNCVVSDPLIKVFCAGTPVFRGRLDSIVAPGGISGHVHKVAGGSNFGPALASQTPKQVFDDMRASPCTSCSVSKVDLSAYWHPDLFYKWPNGSLSLVPKGGLTIYYLARTGSGTQAHPAWTAFPPGFRMISGDPFRRSYNGSNIAHKAISYACLNYNGGGGPEVPYLPTGERYCPDGLRMQVHFPQCWNGKDLDSANHKDHVAFPLERPDGGNCPSTHPIRLFNLFFEAFYSVKEFPHGPSPSGDGQQRFVLACGDPTGYGFHGDFLNGWDQTVLQNVINDASCDATKTNNGNDVRACTPLTQYVQSTPDGACQVSRKVPLTENIGVTTVIPALPGNNPITNGPAQAPIYPAALPSLSFQSPATVRFHLQSVLTGKYTTFTGGDNPLVANFNGALGYSEVFVAKPVGINLYALQTEGVGLQYCSASGPGDTIVCNRGNPSGWEFFRFTAQAGGAVSITADRNGKYFTAYADGTIKFDGTSVGNAQLFKQIVPNGGSAI